MILVKLHLTSKVLSHHIKVPKLKRVALVKVHLKSQFLKMIKSKSPKLKKCCLEKIASKSQVLSHDQIKVPKLKRAILVKLHWKVGFQRWSIQSPQTNKCCLDFLLNFSLKFHLSFLFLTKTAKWRRYTSHKKRYILRKLSLY